MTYIIISIIALIICDVLVFVHIANDNSYGVMIFFILAVICAFIVRCYTENYGVVENVTKYQIDSTLNVKGVDTTKVYTIEYFK